MVDKNRKKRIGELIQQELGTVLLRHSEQPLFTQITITNVNVSADLSFAKVFFSIFDYDKINDAKKVLQQSASFLRKTLAHNLNLRLTPKLEFIFDESIRRGQRISKLIDEAVTKDSQKPQEVE